MIHRHAWRVRAVKPWETFWYDDRGRRVSREQTNVLQVCVRCRKLRTQVISGVWSLDQIDPRAAAERLADELAEMGTEA